MQPTFISQKHASWVLEHSHSSIHYLRCYEQEAQLLNDAGMASDAIAFYGRAFDILVILNKLHDGSDKGLRRKLAMIGLALHRLYQVTGFKLYRLGILQRVLVQLKPKAQMRIYSYHENDLLSLVKAEC
jgi:hypothetical protein